MLVPTLTPGLATAAKSGTSVIVSFASQAGLNYVVRYKNSLLDGPWQTLAQLMGDGAIKFLADPLTASRRFYQVVAE